MVSLSVVQTSNAALKTSLPAGLVAVFAGATAGIGEACLREFARCTSKPRIYFIGRSPESGSRLMTGRKALSPAGGGGGGGAGAGRRRDGGGGGGGSGAEGTAGN